VDEEDIRRVSWRRLEFASVTAFVVATACFLIGQAAEQYASSIAPEVTETAKLRPQFNALDYDATGSVKGGAVVINPCVEQKP
jgi:hypothetical protein